MALLTNLDVLWWLSQLNTSSMFFFASHADVFPWLSYLVFAVFGVVYEPLASCVVVRF